MTRMWLLLLVGCGAGTDGPANFDARDARVPPDAIVPPGPNACGGFDCLRCGRGERCGPEPHLGGSCCTEGDPIEHRASVSASEVVDLSTDGRWIYACGGFGATIYDITDPDDPKWKGVATDRCQHAIAGPDVEGGRVVYFAHHGDSWAGRPRLSTFHITHDGNKKIDEIVDPDTLFEGLAYADGYLYVAAHQGGLRVYQTTTSGGPDHRATLPELGNAWKVELRGDIAYVVDNDYGLHVVSIAEPETPRLIGSVPSIGQPRDLAIAGDRLYLALGSLGVEVFDAREPTAPVPLTHIATRGSAQSVAATDEWLAVAAWTHLALYDADTLHPIAHQRTRHRDQFEQDLAVTAANGRLFVGEWEGIHVFAERPGRVAPDLWLDEDLFAFEGDLADARAVIIRNQGHLPLEVQLETDTAAISVTPSSLLIEPLGAAVAELQYTPPGTFGAKLVLTSNDPDEPRADVVVDVTDSDDRLDVGDTLTDDFAFLDPTGANDLNNLRGQVIVLAYFALF